jgi:hypothetical protein
MEMENITNRKYVENQAHDNLQGGIKTVIDGQSPDRSDYEQIEDDLNTRILEITMKIKDHYPELSPYLEEMPVTVPSEIYPEISLNLLKSYYESLKSLVDKYKVDYPKIEE